MFVSVALMKQSSGLMCVCFLSRWNVVGIQGSLMSYFTEPIYFSSIILGSLYHADHLSRAMYQRIADIEDLPQQFTLNRPLLSGQCLPLCAHQNSMLSLMLSLLKMLNLNLIQGEVGVKARFLLISQKKEDAYPTV